MSRTTRMPDDLRAPGLAVVPPLAHHQERRVEVRPRHASARRSRQTSPLRGVRRDATRRDRQQHGDRDEQDEAVEHGGAARGCTSSAERLAGPARPKRRAAVLPAAGRDRPAVGGRRLRPGASSGAASGGCGGSQRSGGGAPLSIRPHGSSSTTLLARRAAGAGRARAQASSAITASVICTLSRPSAASRRRRAPAAARTRRASAPSDAEGDREHRLEVLVARDDRRGARDERQHDAGHEVVDVAAPDAQVAERARRAAVRAAGR